MQQVMFWDFQTWALLKWQRWFPCKSAAIKSKILRKLYFKEVQAIHAEKPQRGTSRCQIFV